MIVLEKIKICLREDRILTSTHADKRLKERGFTLEEVIEASESFEIIKMYEDDNPFPSYLILGKTLSGTNFHLVLAYDQEDEEVILITIYEPSLDEWEPNLKTRRNQ